MRGSDLHNWSFAARRTIDRFRLKVEPRLVLHFCVRWLRIRRTAGDLHDDGPNTDPSR